LEQATFRCNAVGERGGQGSLALAMSTNCKTP
jgi:hypothetical protein